MYVLGIACRESPLHPRAEKDPCTIWIWIMLPDHICHLLCCYQTKTDPSKTWQCFFHTPGPDPFQLRRGSMDSAMIYPRERQRVLGQEPNTWKISETIGPKVLNMIGFCKCRRQDGHCKPADRVSTQHTGLEREDIELMI